MSGMQALLAGLVMAVVYLLYKVNRLERRLEGRRSGIRTVSMPGGQKVVPILKENIEPGPFKNGNKEKDR
ncbi:MAG TPA: hypothetical protein VD902_19540 [Symbiobacteriaceae bacterium]|nr:hypothetical protein [Symbiobacteriaceae bacterium]